MCGSVISNSEAVAKEIQPTGFLNPKQPRVGGKRRQSERPVGESISRPLFSAFFSPFSAQVEAAPEAEQYAFGLQAAMGRAVMVGRGPTGAGLPLVLPILIVLAAPSCRAQKGWLVDSGANLT